MVVQCTILISSKDYYSCELTRKIPVRVTIVTINGDTGFAIIETKTKEESKIKQYVRSLKAQPTTLDLEVTFQSPMAYWTRLVHKIEGPSIYTTILDSGCMTRLPIVVESGYQKHEILAPSNQQLGSLLKELRSKFTEVKIQRVTKIPSGVSYSPLTDKQQSAFMLAYDSGYFEMPRKCTLSELADELGIKRVAMQERLRRAEIKIVREFVEHHS